MSFRYFGVKEPAMTDIPQPREEHAMTLREELLAMLVRWSEHSVVAENDYTEGVNDGYQECARDVRALLSTADSEQREVLGYSTPWPVDSVLTTLCSFAEMMLRERGYDGHDHESLTAAAEAGRRIILALTRPAEQQEVADLRRKLEEAEARNNRNCDAAVEIRHRLATSFLANAALRTALGSIEHKGCTEDAHIARQALEDVDLPADSLAQEKKP